MCVRARAKSHWSKCKLFAGTGNCGNNVREGVEKSAPRVHAGAPLLFPLALAPGRSECASERAGAQGRACVPLGRGARALLPVWQARNQYPRLRCSTTLEKSSAVKTAHREKTTNTRQGELCAICMFAHLLTLFPFHPAPRPHYAPVPPAATVNARLFLPRCEALTEK